MGYEYYLDVFARALTVECSACHQNVKPKWDLDKDECYCPNCLDTITVG